MTPEERSKLGYRERNGFVAKWIPAFQKGDGVYIQKHYSLEKPKGSDELDLEEIKPLDTPLVQMTQKERRKITKNWGNKNG